MERKTQDVLNDVFNVDIPLVRTLLGEVADRIAKQMHVFAGRNYKCPSGESLWTVETLQQNHQLVVEFEVPIKWVQSSLVQEAPREVTENGLKTLEWFLTTEDGHELLNYALQTYHMTYDSSDERCMFTYNVGAYQIADVEQMVMARLRLRACGGYPLYEVNPYFLAEVGPSSVRINLMKVILDTYPAIQQQFILLRDAFSMIGMMKNLESQTTYRDVHAYYVELLYEWMKKKMPLQFSCLTIQTVEQVKDDVQLVITL